MLEHGDPDCTGTWSLEPEADGEATASVRCATCERRYPAELGLTLEAIRENLLSVQLLALSLTGRLQDRTGPSPARGIDRGA